MIRLENVFYEATGKTILNNVNIDIPTGKIFTFIGPSGAGKSTLLRCINLLAKPSKGSIYFNNVNISSLNENQLKTIRQQMGMIFQHFNLLESKTTFENIALPMRLANKNAHFVHQRTLELLSWINLSDKKDHYPSELSGGQKQRVAIARALALSPKVLLCDEPTSALDPESAKLILSLLKKINRELGITIVFISHQMEVIKAIADKVAVIDQGKIVEVADVIDIFTQPQTEISQRLTQQDLHLILPESIQQRMEHHAGRNKHPIVKLTFIGQSAEQSLLSSLTKLYDVAANILLADIEMIQDSTVGFTICELQGEAKQITQSIRYMRERGILVEVIGYVA